MTPTHKHADGGLYRLLATDVSGKDEGEEWVDGVLYQCCITAKTFWTSTRRFADRFTEIRPGTTRTYRHNLWQDEEFVGAFVFSITEVDDLRSLFIKGKPPTNPNVDPNIFKHVKDVLGAQVEIISKGLHRVDAPIDFLGDVMAFHRKFNQQREDKSNVLPQALYDFRQDFHIEEASEYRDVGEGIYLILDTAFAAGRSLTSEEREQVTDAVADQLDALCDLLFVLMGTVDLQFDRHIFQEAWRRVVRANMAKVKAVPTGDDRSHRDATFDIVKPDGWLAPDHTDLITL